MADQISHRSPRAELRALTGLRGVAATTVALAHYNPPLPCNLQRLLMWHDAAVDLFFCLSGFTLAYVYSRDTFRFFDYLIARVARVYPLYIVTMVVVGAVYIYPLVVDPTSYPAKAAISDFILQAFMMNAWPIIGSGVFWNFPAWSISVEWFCYLLIFPLLLRVILPRSKYFSLLCLLVCSAASYGLFMNFHDERINNPEIYLATSGMSYWVSQLRAIFGFIAGWIAYTSFERKDPLYAFSINFTGCIWLGFGVVLVLWYFQLAHSHLLVFLFPFVVLAATNSNSPASRILGSQSLHFLGIISYSIYMTHFIAFGAFIFAFGAFETWTIPIYILLVSATFLLSIISYFAVELPARCAIREHLRLRSTLILP